MTLLATAIVGNATILAPDLLCFHCTTITNLQTPIIRPIAKWLAQRHLEKLVPDAATRAKLTPGYEMGCKRVLLSDDYLPTFNRPNVHLVTDGIAEITREGVRSKDGTLHKADVLIWGTGFDVIGSVAGLHVTGTGGTDFNTKMVKEGAEVGLVAVRNADMSVFVS